MRVKLLTEHNLEFLSLKRGCTGSSESTLVKMAHCWKPHVAAQMTPPEASCKSFEIVGVIDIAVYIVTHVPWVFLCISSHFVLMRICNYLFIHSISNVLLTFHPLVTTFVIC